MIHVANGTGGSNNVVDRKGIASYLLITFIATYAIEFLLIAAGLRFVNGGAGTFLEMVIFAVMWIPAVATVITVKFVTKEGFALTRLRFDRFASYLLWALLVPVGFAVIYGLVWLLGIRAPDWTLRGFLSLFPGGAKSAKLPLPPGLMIAMIFVGTTVVSPFVNSLWAFGEELGWRGYLLPKLMPLGKARAYLLLGVIWGLWHLPLLLVGFGFAGRDRVLSILLFIAFTTAFGSILNEISLRNKSTFIAAWLHGLFNSQRFGVWAILFAGGNALVSGPFGVVALLTWAAVAAVVLCVRRRRVNAEPG